MKKKAQIFWGTLALTVVLSLPGLAMATDFTDIAADPNKEAIQYVTEQNLFQGTSKTQFSPGQTLDRGMAVTVLSRQAKIQHNGAAVFTDISQEAYYAPAVAWAVNSGIVQGVSADKFEPTRPVTHQELNVMVKRYLSWLGRTGTPQWLAEDNQPCTRAEAAKVFASLDQLLQSRDTKLLEHKAKDGVTLTGKLDVPTTGKVDKLVLYINGSGPNTYDNYRKSGQYEFNYFDLFAQQLGSRNIGFFRWSTRGVTPGSQPPYYADIDEETYKTYVPATSVSDIGEWIQVLRQEEALKDADIYLLGWSEGTIIAPLAAQTFGDEISGLLLAGYANDRMDEIFDWQQTGNPSMIVYKQYFDYDQDGKISQKEYTEDRYGVAALWQNKFEDIDQTKDGFLTVEDFAILLQPQREGFYKAVANNDDQWLKENYAVQLTSVWFNEHKKLKPNREVLPTLTLPIHIFQGTADANCDVAATYAIQKTFQDQKKTNLDVHVYDNFDHDLNYSTYVATGFMPQSFVDIFQTLVTEK